MTFMRTIKQLLKLMNMGLIKVSNQSELSYSLFFGIQNRVACNKTQIIQMKELLHIIKPKFYCILQPPDSCPRCTLP